MPRRAILAALALALLVPSSADAGTPFTIGDGRDPHLLVDPGGTAHVVWRSGTTVRTCEVPRGATACTDAETLTLPGGAEPNAPYLVRGVGNTLYIALPQYASGPNGATFLFTSPDNGSSWSNPGTKIYDFGPQASGSSEPLFGPQPGQLTFAVAPRWVYAADVGAGEKDAFLAIGLAGAAGYDFAIAPSGGGTLVGVANDLTNARFWSFTGGDPSSGGWSAGASISRRAA